MEQKYRFLDTMLARMGALRDEAAHGGKQAVLCGDFNIAHTPLDIKNAKANEKHAGFLPEERAYVDKWLDEYEFVDVMRSLAGDIQGPYTWWSQRGRAFDNNVGWRIDYQFATPELAETARGFVIDKAPTYDKRWSDHAPLTITYAVSYTHLDVYKRQSQPMLPGRNHAVSSTDSAVAMPPGNAKVTTRFKNPGI